MSAEIREDLDIAVVGLSGRFPGAENCTEFWRNLLMGVDGISRFTEEELLQAGHDIQKIRNKDFVPVNGVLEGANYFDAEFFGYSQAEAALLDPQTRLMMQCVWHALENAGIDPDKRGRNIGLFLGARSTVQWTMQAMLSEQVENVGGFLASQLANKDAMSTLISWKLGLEGPSFTLQTACSTSLVSVHQAVQSLLSGECDVAVAGGVSLLLPQQNGHTYQDGMLFSKDGKTRAFDAEATGSVFGSGLGAVVLRRAGDAIADNDPIWAILKGSAINNDGARKVGYTAPSVKGQSDVIRSALQMAEMNAADLDFIECHGTATSLGDSIEFMALCEVFNEKLFSENHPSADLNQCALGSVKTNIGHLDSAAGIAGFIKMVMAIRYGVIPPTLHFQRPNSQLGFEQSPFYINTCAEPWSSKQGKLRTGGVSSFGIGGTNAHMVLQQYISAAGENTAKLCFFPFSAKNRASLALQLESVSQWLVQQSHLDLQALSHTLGKRRSFPCRIMFAADSKFVLMQQIKTYLEFEEDEDVLTLIPQFLEKGAVLPDERSEVLVAFTNWISGQTKEPAKFLFSPFNGQPLIDIPGYAFMREEHGAGHITDKRWRQIASVIAATGDNNLSKNMPGLLLPFWKPVRLPKASVQEKAQEKIPHSVLLCDQSLASQANDWVDKSQIEMIRLNMLCSDQVRNALAELSHDLQKNRSLVLSLVFPSDGFSFAPDSLQTLSDLGKVLVENDFSAFGSVHIYLVMPAMTGDGGYSAASVLTEAALKALALVIPQEIPGIECAFLYLQEHNYLQKFKYLQKYNADGIASTLTRLLQTPLHGPLKLNHEGLFVEDFRCPDAEENEVVDESHFMGKTYVITGAGGRMAKAMAKVIAQRFQGKLALISRQSADSAAMQRLLMELQEAGAGAVEIFPYALESEEDALTLFKSIRHRLGDIHAVIHAAGVTDGDSFSPLVRLNAEHYQAQLQPKAQVAAVLTKVFESIPVEYCFVTSSMSVFFGGIAHAPYAMANLFLDGWGQRQNRRPQNPRWIVVNWETIHFDEKPHLAEEERDDALVWGRNEVAFSGFEFPALFERSLREYDRENQKIFSAGQFMDRLYAWGGRRIANGDRKPQATSGIKLKPRPETLHSVYQPPANEMQKEITAIWSQILGIDGIGIDDKFMALGGDSLKTIVMAEKVYKKIGKRVAIQDFFAQPTIREIERQFLNDEQDVSPSVLPSVDLSEPIIASSDQDLLYIHQITFANSSYNMPMAFRCPSSISAASITEAIEQVADRYPVLKCLFERQGADLMMLPQRDTNVGMLVSEAGERQEENFARLEQFANMPFDLHTELPIRAMMLTGSGAFPFHQVLIVVHHIVCDAVSLGILADDFQRLLQGLPLPAPEYSFAAYRRYRLESENEDKVRKEKAYWLANLLPLPAPLSLPVVEGYDWHTDAERDRGIMLEKDLSPQTSLEIRQLCDELGLPAFTFFLGVFGVLMAKISRADSFLLGVPVTGRMQPEELALVGYLVNMLALKIEPEADLPMADYLLQLNAQWAESVPYQTYPMSVLLEDLSAERHVQGRRGKHPLFDVVFGYLPLSLNGADESNEVNKESGFSRLELTLEAVKFDLAMDVSETRDSFNCTIQFRQQMFSEATVTAVFDYFFVLINEVIANPDEEIQELLKSLNYGYAPESSAQASDQDIDSEFNF
ncbi:beta-ketoacyl synthase N-terminal-like domain-containing protein [Xenorhabdus sp. XENO-10]|uniref:Beta-ketoacyl synthase N-terminal-like domain-containing protein n=1 Tax=Xenorhabdus yunnanensis TaxID=3025878 RepID=A0ABT5LEQ7_9GAMM|nr:beta-ketoacyl synthase N-terminal-like domain-containing protein [Xenorhabdus yunnanensis]MDC9589598.1 beta-ketoacyl synthase N-terminal-like domain-containing protein [Xenorhabdus yunnanensis]